MGIDRRKSCEENGIRRGVYSFTTQATHKPFDALAVDAWATLAAELGGVDWVLVKGCRRSFDDGGWQGLARY
jgi:hypothetical protein